MWAAAKRLAMDMSFVILLGVVVFALNVPRWHDNPNLKIQGRVRQPETIHDVWTSCLSAWLARAPKSPKGSRA
jgi:hypothetical protein